MNTNTLSHKHELESCCGRILKKVVSRKSKSYILELKLEIDAGSISPHQSLRLVPILEGAGFHMELPCILINGYARHRSYRGLFGLQGFFRKKQINDSYRIYRAIQAGDDLQLDYHISLSYKPWMENSKIFLSQD